MWIYAKKKKWKKNSIGDVNYDENKEKKNWKKREGKKIFAKRRSDDKTKSHCIFSIHIILTVDNQCV